LEATRLTPHIEKNLAQEVLGKRLIGDRDAVPLFSGGSCKIPFLLVFFSRNIVLVATVDRTESHARNSLPELRASIAQPPVFRRGLLG
jgi:hypothetical protein